MLVFPDPLFPINSTFFFMAVFGITRRSCRGLGLWARPNCSADGGREEPGISVALSAGPRLCTAGEAEGASSALGRAASGELFLWVERHGADRYSSFEETNGFRGDGSLNLRSHPLPAAISREPALSIVAAGRALKNRSINETQYSPPEGEIGRGTQDSGVLFSYLN